MGFSIVCHECGYCLYEGMDMIVLYRLRRKIDNKCPGCGRTLSIHPLSIEIEDQETNKAWLIEKPRDMNIAGFVSHATNSHPHSRSKDALLR